MIYSVYNEIAELTTIPIERITYNDQNGFKWEIIREEDGFYIVYNGDKYFMQEIMVIELPDGSFQKVKNHGCFHVKDSDFETFCHVRDILKNGYTDEIWDIIEELLEERFIHDRSLIDSELL